MKFLLEHFVPKFDFYDVLYVHPTMHRVEEYLESEKKYIWRSEDLEEYETITNKLKDLNEKGIEIWQDSNVEESFYVFENKTLIYIRKYERKCHECALKNCLKVFMKELVI